MTMPKGLSPNAYLPGSLKTELDLAAPIGPGSPKKSVRWVQERLTLAGHGLKIDGDFGPATDQQLKNFQQANGLAASGRYGQPEHDQLTQPFVKALNPLPTAGLGAMIVVAARQHIRQHPIE